METDEIITNKIADASAVDESRCVSYRKKTCKIILITVFSLYLAFLLYQTFLSPIYGRAYSHRCINMIPFKTIGQFMSAKYNKSIKIINIVGNIVVFMPLGIMLPLLSKRLSGIAKGVIFSAGLAVAIEAAQYIFAVGVTDIDDIILNVLGGFLGSVLFSHAHNAIERNKHLSSM
jgi:glycopeptide antibiotics resistance protein